MRVRDRVFGVISFVSAESGRRFGDADLRLAEDLALRAATAVENARLYRARSAIARTLQASLLPPLLPEVPGVEAGALYRAGGRGHEVGGDFYDVFSDRRGPLVRGHRRRLRQGRRGGGGDRAGALHDPRRGGRAPLAGGDPALGQRGDAAPRSSTARFCTIAVRAPRPLAPPTTRLTVAVRRPSRCRCCCARTARSRRLGAGGTLLGLVERPEARRTATTELRPGDALVLYTDGVTEARRARAGVDAGGARARSLAGGRRRDRAAARRPRRRGRARGSSAPPRDDIAILALRAAAAQPGGVAGGGPVVVVGRVAAGGLPVAASPPRDAARRPRPRPGASSG